MDRAQGPGGLPGRCQFFRTAEDGVDGYARHVFGLAELQSDKRPLRAHLAPLARRGDPDALALLRAPDFPHHFAYLFDWFGEFQAWAPRERAPEWNDWLAWATLMRRDPTPSDLRMLRRIYDAATTPKPVSASHG